jgi:hypothetical protein
VNGPDRQTVTHRCRCVLYTYSDDGDRCPNPATPDSPFCDQCEDRHRDMLPAVLVGAVPLTLTEGTTP